MLIFLDYVQISYQTKQSKPQKHPPEVFYKKRPWKRDSGAGVFLWILRIFKKTFFTEHLWKTPSENKV